MDLDNIQRSQFPRIGTQFQREMRLAVGQATRDFSAGAGCVHRINRVYIEADMQTAITMGGKFNGLFHNRGHTQAINLFHREDVYPNLAQKGLLAWIQVA